jgi:hypothetical protein
LGIYLLPKLTFNELAYIHRIILCSFGRKADLLTVDCQPAGARGDLEEDLSSAACTSLFCEGLLVLELWASSSLMGLVRLEVRLEPYQMRDHSIRQFVLAQMHDFLAEKKDGRPY